MPLMETFRRGMLCPGPLCQAEEEGAPLWTFCEKARHPEAISSIQGTYESAKNKAVFQKHIEWDPSTHCFHRELFFKLKKNSN